MASEAVGPFYEQVPFDGGGFASGLIGDISTAVRLELAALSVSTPTDLSAGRLVGAMRNEEIWSFAVGADVTVEPEPPGRLIHLTAPPVDARVLAVGDSSVIVSVSDSFSGSAISISGEADSFTNGGRRLDSDGWQLTSDPQFIYRKLLERLDELRASDDCDEALLQELVMPEVYTEAEEAEDGDGESAPLDADEEQERAARLAIQPGIRFTWGPPGTGKTRVLGRAAVDAARDGSRVLVLSHANVAVDVAIERIAGELEGDELLGSGRVLRVGTPQSASMLRRGDLLPDHLASVDQPETAERIGAIESQIRAMSNRARTSNDETIPAQLVSARSELRELRSQLRQRTNEIIDNAMVIAATLSRAVVEDLIWESEFDVVIVDEASMAPLPFVLALVLRGATTVSFFGDFRQLPPIAVSTDDRARGFFARDVFEFGNVVHAHELGHVDPRLSVLRTQFRMGAQICDTVSDLSYDGLLRTAPSARDNAIHAAERGIGPGTELVIVDTSSLGTECLVEVDPDGRSRLSLLSAALAASLAETLVGDGFESVGVISPYRAQAQLINAFASSVSGIDAATVHRFQGSERSAIVFDLTDASPMTRPSRLTGTDVDLARRLLNVAASRAKEKLVVLADLAFVDHCVPLGSPIRLLLEFMDGAGAVQLEGAEVVQSLTATGGLTRPAPGRSVKWLPTWRDVTATLTPLVHGGSRFEANTGPSQALVDSLRTIEGALDEPQRSIVRCSRDVAEALDATEFDRRLLCRGAAPWVVVDEVHVAIGSTNEASSIALITSPQLVSIFRRIVAPLDL